MGIEPKKKPELGDKVVFHASKFQRSPASPVANDGQLIKCQTPLSGLQKNI